jgi:hypothetical protein
MAAKPGPKPLPPESRKICRVILNLYPVEFAQIAHVAFEYDLLPRDVARNAIRIGLPELVRQMEFSIENPHNQ